MKKKLLYYSFSIICILFIWYFVSFSIKADLILSMPHIVFLSLFKQIKTVVFWKCFCFTFGRVVISFLISVVIGVFIGWIMSINDNIKTFFEIPVSIIRSTPVIAVIMVALFWFKSGSVPVFVSVLMSLPVIITSVLEGLSFQNNNLLFMAHSFNFSKKQIFKYIQLPSLIPHIASGCHSSFGLCWKVVAAGEVLSLPKYGLGTIMNKAQVHLETSEVLAVTIILVLVSFLIDKLLRMVIKYGR